jgi:hypothetical protein
MNRASICRRCHRIRVVDWTRICAPCSKVLDEMGRPHHRVLEPISEDPTVDETPPSDPMVADEPVPK